MRWAVELLALVAVAHSLDNGAARTPPLGWSTWNKLRCNFDADVLLGVADAMVEGGLVKAGYRTLNIDDCWPLKKRGDDGKLAEDPSKFPNGMKNFSAELQKRGLGLGIYTSHGNLTCQKYPGSYGYEDLDAQAYADWGVDYVKNDWCSNRDGYPAVPDLEAFERMRDALNRTGKPMVYSVHWNYGNTKGPTCDKGESCPLPNIANMWRIGGDIQANWGKVLGIIDIDSPLAANAGPGRWNDADMLEVGNGMTEDQDKAHFAMWCMLASPLIAGNDVRTMSDSTRAILTNPHVIAVNQDPLGKQATVVDIGTENADTQVWARRLAEPAGSWAVTLLNRGETAQNITANFATLDGGDVIFKTPNDQKYHLPVPNPGIASSGSLRYVKFSVKARNDAHISLRAGKSFYSFIFGGSGNTQTWIRKNTETQKYPGTVVDVVALNASEYVDLWVSIATDTGNVAMGRGSEVGHGVVTEFADGDVLTPTDFVVRTGWGSAGFWRFGDANKTITSTFNVLDLWQNASVVATDAASITAAVPPTAATMYKLVPYTEPAVMVV